MSASRGVKDVASPQLGLSQARVSRASLKALPQNPVTSTPSHAIAKPVAAQAKPKTGPMTAFGEKIGLGPAPTGYPWYTVGKVQVGWNSNYDLVQWSGTGVLVGQNLLLTAGHLAPWGKSGWWMRFAAGYNDGTTPYSWVYVETYYGYDDESLPAANDYIICKLYSSLGNTVGWMGSVYWSSDTNYTGTTWTSLGYPANVPIAATDVQVSEVNDASGDDKLLLTEEFAQAGWAGSPLWSGGASGTDNPQVAGILSGVLSGDSAFAGGEDLVNLVWYGLEYMAP
jgi:V8-like Glu-specific endopeptidase